VTGSGQAALDLAQAAIKDLTGRETIIDCRARKITAEDLPAALAAGPAALLLPTEVLYSEDQKAWLQAVAAARQENILVIHDERGLGLRRPPGVLPQAVPSPDAAIYGSSLANGYEIGAFVAGPELWNVVGKLAWSGPAKPALAAANAMLRLDPAIFKKLELAGEKLLLAWQEAAAITGLEIRITGSPIFPAFEFTGEDKAQLHLAFVAHMKGQGVLADSFAYLQLSDYYDHSLVRKINLAFASLATT
jgi:glutamate-1-semialdehyde aminotransferase